MIKNVTINNDVNITASFESSDIGTIISEIQNGSIDESKHGIIYSRDKSIGTLNSEFTTGLLKKVNASLSYIKVDSGLFVGITYDYLYESEIYNYNFEVYLNNKNNPSNGWYMGSLTSGIIEFVWDDSPWIHQLILNERITVKIVLVKK